MPPRYPDIEVKLSDKERNPFLIAGLVRASLLRAGVPRYLIHEFTEEAVRPDYDRALHACQTWVRVT